MFFPFYIARRYLFSKKSTHAINIISGVAMAGVAVATMAMVVTLSVFNGFRDLVATLFTSFDPQLTIVPAQGKTVAADDPALLQIKALPDIDTATECLEDNALAVYGERQALVTVKGVSDNFAELTHITEILYGDGEFRLETANLQYGILGIRLAQQLGTGARWPGYLHIYAPKREGQIDMATPTESFVIDSLLSPGVVFCVSQAKYDNHYILVPISFARQLFDRQGRLSSLELRLRPGSDLSKVKAAVREIAGERFRVLDRYEQQADTFHVMSIEKLIAYVFLTFILVVACFNIIGAVSMLIIDKCDDRQTLRNLGATNRQIRQVFLFEGWLISLMGAVIGIVLGLLLCWLQQTFGLVSLGSTSGTFVVNAYPVSVHPGDVVIVFATVVVIGCIAVWFPTRRVES